MKLAVALFLAAAASAGAVRNPLGDALDALVNDEHFFRGHRLQRLLDDDADDAACAAEMEAIYSNWGFMKTVFKINNACPPELDMTDTSISMTQDYSDCDEESTFDDACAGVSGVTVDVPDIAASCTLEDEDTTYTSSYSMKGTLTCAGVSCSTEYDAAEAKKTGDEVAAQMESEMAGLLAIFGVEGTVACDVTIGAEETPGSRRKIDKDGVPPPGSSYCTYAPDTDCYVAGWPQCCGNTDQPCPTDRVPRCDNHDSVGWDYCIWSPNFDCYVSGWPKCCERFGGTNCNEKEPACDMAPPPAFLPVSE